MFVDAALYLAVIPLLPQYVDRFGLSTFQAGVVIAAYPVSVPLVSLGCIVLVPRVGARRITLVSAGLMTVATVIFAWAPNATVLVAARLVQGFASGSIWTGSMAWVTDNAPAGRRGRESGIVMGMLSAGSVAGPAVGALAAWAGQELAFGLVAAVSLLGVVLAALAPSGRVAGAPTRLETGARRRAAPIGDAGGARAHADRPPDVRRRRPAGAAASGRRRHLGRGDRRGPRGRRGARGRHRSRSQAASSIVSERSRSVWPRPHASS